MGVVTPPPGVPLTITVAGDVTIALGGSIDLHGKGYQTQGASLSVLDIGVQNGQTILTITGGPDKPYVLQFSIDLVNWLDRVTNATAAGSFDYLLPPAEAGRSQFFRARQLTE